MRILVCNWKDTAHPHAGGAEVYTHEVLRRWAAAGHEVTLFCAAVPGRPERELVDGVRVVRRGGRLGVYRQARRFLREVGPAAFDVAIDEVNTRPFGLAGVRGAPPVVALVHQVAREIWFSELPLPLAALGRFVLEPAWLRAYRDVPVLTVSPSSRDSLRAYGLRRISIVPEGVAVEPRGTPPAKEPLPTLVFVGRLTESKRPKDALAAFRLIRAQIPSARLWVIGTGPLEQRLRRLHEPGVTFHGRISEEAKLDLVARAHALVVTSVREGWGLVVDEAAAMATPAVGYDVPGLADSIPTAGGVLVPPSPSALAAELLRRLPVWLRQPARAGWAGGARSWDEVADAVLQAVVAETGCVAAPAARLEAVRA